MAAASEKKKLLDRIADLERRLDALETFVATLPRQFTLLQTPVPIQPPNLVPLPPAFPTPIWSTC